MQTISFEIMCDIFTNKYTKHTVDGAVADFSLLAR